jgi:hypothetical protein
MAKVHIVDPSDQSPAGSPDRRSHLTTMHEQIHENMNSQVSIVHTVEAMQMAVEEFSEHVDGCNVSFKQCIMEKVKALKQSDTTILTERVSLHLPQC